MNEPLNKASGLTVRGIKKSFGINVVLKGIDLQVPQGSVVALIGGNGAGKSTLVKIIMGIYQADEGEIYMGEKLLKLGKLHAQQEQAFDDILILPGRKDGEEKEENEHGEDGADAAAHG